MKFRMVPANGTPLSLRDLWHIFCLLITRRNKDCHAELVSASLVGTFEETFSNYIGLNYSFACSSGRAALYIALKVIHSLSPKKREVIIPVYTCQTVLFSVLKAGLTPVYCDITEDTLNMDISKLKGLISERTLCIVVAYMFGYPCDIEKIVHLAKTNNFYVIEDVAQSCGAEWNGKKLGSFGDISFFSFGPSKNFTTVKGGMICTNSERLASLLEREIECLKSPGFFYKFYLHLMFIAHYIVIKPFFFYFLTKSHIKFTETEFSQNFKAEKITNLQSAIGIVLLKLLDAFNARRIKNERLLLQGLPGLKNKLSLIDSTRLKAVSIRLPIVVKNEQQRKVLIKKLVKKGIWARSSVYVPLNILEEGSYFEKNGGYPVAESIYKQVVIIPTHPYLSSNDIKNAIKLLKKVYYENQG